RRLVKEDVTVIAGPESRPELPAEPQGQRRRRRGGRGRAGRPGPPRPDSRERERGAPGGPPHPVRAPTPPEPRTPVPEPGVYPAPVPGEAHTAPHDEVISVVRELVEASRDRPVSIDTLANALKARGFRRPPGSPRLLTRLRRIREIVVSSSGGITLASEAVRREPEPGAGDAVARAGARA